MIGGIHFSIQDIVIMGSVITTMLGSAAKITSTITVNLKAISDLEKSVSYITDSLNDVRAELGMRPHKLPGAGD